VFGIGFDGRRDRRRSILGPSFGGLDCDDALFALGERPRLVEDDGIERSGVLHGDAVADEDAVVRGHRGVDGDDEQHRQSERVRAGDDEYRDDPFHHIEAEAGGEKPRDSGDGRDQKRDVKEPPDRPVGQQLRSGSASLCLLDEPHDSCEGRLVARRIHPDSKASIAAVDSSCDDLVVGALAHRARFAGYYRLVRRRLAALDHAVRGNARSGANQHPSAVYNSETGTSSVSSSLTIRSAVSGMRRANSSSAPEACRTLRISNQWQSSMMSMNVTIS
jgi:hypothetical protein